MGSEMCIRDSVNFFANGRKRLTSTGVGLWLGHHLPGDQYPTLGPEGWLWPTVYCQCSKGDVSWRGSVWIWRKCQITRRVASLCPKQRSQSSRTPLPPRSCALESGDMMNSTAQLSLKRLAYAAIINSSAKEYDTPSTINDEGDLCEKEDGPARTTPHYLWSIRVKGQTPTRPTRRKPCWESGPVMSPPRNTRPRPFCHVMSPSGNIRVRPFGPVMSPFRTPGLGRFVM